MRVLRAGWFMALTVALVAACVPTLPVTPAKNDKKASAAPSSKGDYYPMAEGTKWVYEMKLGDKVVGTATTRLKDVETEDDTTTAVAVTVLAFVGDTPAVTRATETKTATELTSVSGGTTTIGLKFPLKKNATWTSNGSTYKVVGQETVKVGTGDVKDAWKITQTSDAGAATFWYGAGVGLVKFTSPGPEGEVTSTLKTFTASGAPALPEESGASPSPSPSASASASPSPSPSPSASASASPSPSPSASPSGITVPTGEVDYFPMREGAKWVYAVKAKAFGLQVGTMTNRMGAVATADTTPEATMTSVLNITVPAPQKQVTAVKYKKLAAEVQRAIGDDPYATFFKLPLTVDATWEADGSSFKVEAKEDVTLSSGVIKDALRISTTTDGAKDVFWYGSQIGMIKFTATVQGNEIEAELKEYTASGTAALPEETE